jgi:hypothetical protein
MGEAVQTVNYRVADRDLKYYVFDWDDNILHMPTRVYLERLTDDGQWVPHPVSTSVFSAIRTDRARYRPERNDWEWACRDCRDVDVDNENIFLRDTRTAVDRVAGGQTPAPPSFVRFRQVLTEGRLFAIVTARGHAPEVIRRAVEYFVGRVLSPEERAQMLTNLRGYIACFDPDSGCRTDAEVLDHYLRHNRYHGICSTHFKELMKKIGAGIQTPEQGKQFAIRDFVEHVVRISREQGLPHRPVSIGFSDDDIMNARAVEDYIRKELARDFPFVKFVVYYTADPDLPEGRKTVVHGQLTLPFPRRRDAPAHGPAAPPAA